MAKCMYCGQVIDWTGVPEAPAPPEQPPPVAPGPVAAPTPEAAPEPVTSPAWAMPTATEATEAPPAPRKTGTGIQVFGLLLAALLVAYLALSLFAPTTLKGIGVPAVTELFGGGASAKKPAAKANKPGDRGSTTTEAAAGESTAESAAESTEKEPESAPRARIMRVE